MTTPWDLFQLNFLAFGLHASFGIFPVVIDEVIQGLDGVPAYQDDVTYMRCSIAS